MKIILLNSRTITSIFSTTDKKSCKLESTGVNFSSTVIDLKFKIAIEIFSDNYYLNQYSIMKKNFNFLSLCLENLKFYEVFRNYHQRYMYKRVIKSNLVLNLRFVEWQFLREYDIA